MPDNDDIPPPNGRRSLRPTAARQARAPRDEAEWNERQNRGAAATARRSDAQRNRRQGVGAGSSTEQEQSMEVDAPEIAGEPTAHIEEFEADGPSLEVATRPAQNDVAVPGNAAAAFDPNGTRRDANPLRTLGQAINLRLDQAGLQVAQYVEQRVNDAQTRLDQQLAAAAPQVVEYVDARANMTDANNRRLLDELATLIMNHLGAAGQELNQSRAELSAARQVFDQSRTEFDAARDELAAAREVFDQSRAEFNTARDELRTAHGDLDRGRDELEAAHSELIRGNDALNTARGEYNSGNNELRVARNRLNQGREELEATRGELGQFRDQWDGARTEYDRGRTELRTTRGELNEALAQLSTAQTELNQGQRELATARSEADRVGVQLTAARREFNDGRTELGAALDELNQGRGEFGVAQEEFNRGRDELGAARTELNERRDALDIARDETNQDHTELGATTTGMDEIREELNAARAEIRQVRDELNSARTGDGQQVEERANAQLVAMTEHLNELQISNGDLATQLQALQESNSNRMERSAAEPAPQLAESAAAPIAETSQVGPDVAARPLVVPGQEGVRLVVPSTTEERSAARAQGAQWDSKTGDWMAPANADLSKFAKWVPLSSYLGDMENASIALPAETDVGIKLAVPFRESGAARAGGAWWDKNEKTWMLPAGGDLNKVKPWVPLSYYTADTENILKVALPERLEARFELAVPPEKGRDAKADGAERDRATGCWNAPADADLRKFGKWVPLSHHIAGRERVAITVDAPVKLAVTHQNAAAAENAGAIPGERAGQWIAPAGVDLSRLAQWVSSSAYLEGKVAERIARDRETHGVALPATRLDERSRDAVRVR